LVTGRPPFEADTPSAVMHKHLKEPLVPPDHVNSALSAGISEIVEVAMAKKREERYSSTRDMLEDLRMVRAGEGAIHARRDIKLDVLAKVEESAGKTVDIPVASVEEPAKTNILATIALIALGVSV